MSKLQIHLILDECLQLCSAVQHIIRKLSMPLFIYLQRRVRLFDPKFLIKLHHLVAHTLSGFLDKGLWLENFLIELVNSIFQLVLKFSDLARVRKCFPWLWRFGYFRLNDSVRGTWSHLNGFMYYFRFLKVRLYFDYILLNLLYDESVPLFDVCYAIAVCIDCQIPLHCQYSLIHLA